MYTHCHLNGETLCESKGEVHEGEEAERRLTDANACASIVLQKQ
jgi:hypothetical protein